MASSKDKSKASSVLSGRSKTFAHKPKEKITNESDMQVSLLRRMRFKIASKILLHELNLHSQKMYDLAFKFQEIDEQTRISNIVNAIKNRADRDPEKVVRKEDVLKPDK